MLPIIGSTRTSSYDHKRFCGILDVPASNEIFTEVGYYIWDPTVFLIGGTYYMVYSRWPDAAGDNGYATDSEICLATAANANGPFAHNSVLLQASGGANWDSTSVHNPKVIRVGSRWLLYYLGYDAGTVGQVGVAGANSIGGPYIRSVGNPVVPKGGVGDWDSIVANNPAPLYDNGTYYVWYKGWDGVMAHPAIGLAVASSWDGPYTKEAGNPVFGTGVDDRQDPHVWKENGIFRMTVVVPAGDTNVPAHGTIWAWSVDGITWTQPEFGYRAYEAGWFGATILAAERTSFLDLTTPRTYMYVGLWHSGLADTKIGYAIFKS